MQFCGSPHRDCIRHPMCFLCFFLLRKTQKHNDQMFLCLLLGLGLHQTAYVFLCFCVVVFSENLFGLFFNNKIAPESQCVFVFFFRRKKNNQMCFCLLFFNNRVVLFPMCFCFFSLQKTQNTMTKFFCLFFSNRIAPESQCVCVFLCYFSENTKTPNVFVFFQQFHKNTLFIY